MVASWNLDLTILRVSYAYFLILPLFMSHMTATVCITIRFMYVLYTGNICMVVCEEQVELPYHQNVSITIHMMHTRKAE